MGKVEKLKKLIVQVANYIYNKNGFRYHFESYEEVCKFLKACNGNYVSEYLFEVLIRWPSNEMDRETLQELCEVFRNCPFLIGYLFNFPIVGNISDFYDQQSIKISKQNFAIENTEFYKNLTEMYASRNYEVNLYNEFDFERSIEYLEDGIFTYDKNLVNSFKDERELNEKTGNFYKVFAIEINSDLKNEIDKVFIGENESILKQMKSFINVTNEFSLNDVKYILQKCQQSQITLFNEILDELIDKCQDKLDQDLIIMLFMGSFNVLPVGFINVIQISETGTLAKIFSKTEDDVKINFELLGNIFSRVDKIVLNDEDLKQILLRCLPTFRINSELFFKIFEYCLYKSLTNDTILLLLKQTDDKAIYRGYHGEIFRKFSSIELVRRGYEIVGINNALTPEFLEELFRCVRYISVLGSDNVKFLINSCEGKFNSDFVEKLFKSVREDEIDFYPGEFSTFLSKFDNLTNNISCSAIYNLMSMSNFLEKCENGEERFDNDLFVCVLNLCRENDVKAKFFRRLVNILMNNEENKKQICLYPENCKCLRNGFLDVETLSYLLDCGFYFSKRVFEENLSIFAKDLFTENFPNNLTCSPGSKIKFVSTYNDWEKEENQMEMRIRRGHEPVPHSIIIEDPEK